MTRSDIEIMERQIIRQRLEALSRDELKSIIKESNKEWLDEKLNQAGRWTLRIAVSSIFVYLLSLVVMAKK